MISVTSNTLLYLPLEVILHIFSFLDLPDLASISHISSVFAVLASDPVLHQTRLRIVAPSRVSHSLFGQSPQGIALRPTVGDLVNRHVMRGLGMERRWRTGIYLYSAHSVKQYESSILLQRRHASIIVSSHLRHRLTNPNTLKALHQSHVLPDVESSSLSVSRTLLPIMHKLKWSLQRDRFAQMVRTGVSDKITPASGFPGFGTWLQNRGRNVVQDGERVRLAVCPGVRKIVTFYEELSH